MSLGVSKLQIEIKLGCWRKVLGNREAVCLYCLITEIPSVSRLERLHPKAVAYPGILFGGELKKFSWGQRTDRTGIWGR